jgi:hypothetical protein
VLLSRPGQQLLQQLQQHWLGLICQLQQLAQGQQRVTYWQLVQQLLLLPLQQQIGLLGQGCCLRGSRPCELGLRPLQAVASYAGLLLLCLVPACCHWSKLLRLHVPLLQLQQWMP